jgi:hypothetical protein
MKQQLIKVAPNNYVEGNPAERMGLLREAIALSDGKGCSAPLTK